MWADRKSAWNLRAADFDRFKALHFIVILGFCALVYLKVRFYWFQYKMTFDLSCDCHSVSRDVTYRWHLWLHCTFSSITNTPPPCSEKHPILEKATAATWAWQRRLFWEKRLWRQRLWAKIHPMVYLKLILTSVLTLPRTTSESHRASEIAAAAAEPGSPSVLRELWKLSPLASLTEPTGA